MTSKRSRYASVTESQFQEQVLQLLKLNGWKVAHFTSATIRGRHMTPVQADGKGWPDLFCVHAPSRDKLALELKREYGPTTPEQLQWLAWLEACGIEALVVRPSDIDQIIERVRKAR